MVKMNYATVSHGAYPNVSAPRLKTIPLRMPPDDTLLDEFLRWKSLLRPPKLPLSCNMQTGNNRPGRYDRTARYWTLHEDALRNIRFQDRPRPMLPGL